MPASPLPMQGDDPREARGGVVPVRLGSPLRAIRLSGGDGGGNLLVFLHRRRKLVHQDADVDPCVALALRLDGFVKAEQPWPDDSIDVCTVNFEIEREDARRVATPARLDGHLTILRAHVA